jgi:hypothetical protein
MNGYKIYDKDSLKLKKQSLDKLIEDEKNILPVLLDETTVFSFKHRRNLEFDKNKKFSEIEKDMVLCISVNSNKYSHLLDGQLVFQHSWDNQLVFQLGMRLWKVDDKQSDDDDFDYKMQSADFFDVKKKLSEITISKLETLLNLLPSKYKYTLQCYYDPNKNKNKNEYEIYGIVSIYYRPLNQKDFRDMFIECCKSKQILLDLPNTPKQYYSKKYDCYLEYMTVILNKDISSIYNLNLIISYGKNNGHKSYYFYWLLTLGSGESLFIKASEYKWRNNPREIHIQGMDFPDFISSLIEEGEKIIKETTDKIHILEKQGFIDQPELFDKKVNEVLSNIKVSQGTKDKIKQTIYSLKENEKESYWLIEKALIVYGDIAHKDTYESMQNLIKKAQVSILEYGFDEAIEKWKQEGGIKVTDIQYQDIFRC